MAMLLVVVQVVDELYVSVIQESERDPPVAVDSNRPIPFQLAFQFVQPEAGYIHVSRDGRYIEQRQYPLQLGAVCRLDPLGGAGGVKVLEPFVLETHDHCKAALFRCLGSL